MTRIESNGGADLTQDAVVQAALGTRWVALSDDSVVLDVLTDRVFRLNATAAFIWQRLQEPRRVGELQAEVRRAYEIDEIEAELATSELLRELVAEGLVGASTRETGKHETAP